MKKFIYICFILPVLALYHCGNDTSVNNVINTPSDYVKIFTAESGANKFEVYSKSASSFIYGYNNIGFKVFISGSEQNQGFVRFKPTMYHGLGGPSHSVPVPEKYFYDSDKQLFTGYSVFIMYDTAAFWAADFNYNDLNTVDSIVFPLAYSTRTKILAWDNSLTEKTYFLTMVTPAAPVVGLNDLEFMFHQTSDMTNYEEINNAEMFIRPWMESMGHGSGNNVDPVYTAPGTYKGVVNFNMPGEWFLYDSIKVNGSFVTDSPAPKFILQVN